jgi:hypothetical protein
MRESGGRLRGEVFSKRDWGWIEVESLTLADGTDLAPAGGYVTATASGTNPDDRTVARYPLPRPVPAGGWIEVDISFTARLPEIFARTGVHGDYVLAGQWFPKIAVFEDAGDRGRAAPGWNAHQFHANSEFYADFGDYDVTLDLPASYAGKVGATGRRVEAAEGTEPAAEGRVKVRFVQRGVHDFAWTADPRFVVVRERFDPERDVPAAQRRRIAERLGLPPGDLALRPVDIELFVSPAHAALASRYVASAKAGLRGYGLRLGAYPYATLTLVDPPRGALGSGGMEYPTFITLGTMPLLGIPPFTRLLAPEVVTIHEFGHQYFQGMLASNEFEEAWLDEGINSYYETVVMDEEYEVEGVLPGLLRVTPYEFQHATMIGGYSDPVVAPPWRYMTGNSYGQNSYPRPAVTLFHLEGLLGEQVFARAMRAYFQDFQFRHPTTADFVRTVERVSGRDLGWFFSQALHTTRELDYGVRRLRTSRVEEPVGVFWRDGERVEVERDEDDDEAENEGDAETRRWRSEVVVYRWGEFIHPVTVEMRFDDGTTLRREWDGRARWARWRFEGPAELVAAEVDPDHLMALDVDRVNNGRLAEPERTPVVAMAADLLYWIQSLFNAAAFFA